MRIVSAKNVFENNEFFREITLKCRNPQCSEYNKEVLITRPLKVEKR